ncbi:MAG: CAP domain-containing protein, partial [bacterium]
MRHGPERLAIAYDDPHRAEKDVLFARINRDREEAGVPPVAYEPRAALVGDLFCLDTAMEGAFGHWDLRGRAPFLRWAQAGGVDFHTENAASYSVSSGRVDRPLTELLLKTHAEMMAERPPADGHRRAVLDPNHTHVGIGLAVVGGEFRMTEEFTAVAFEWIEIPSRAVRAGEWASFAGLVSSGTDIETIEVRHEPPPRPLSLHDLQQRGSYAYPRIVR